jgi:polyisoprenoid-binding protein YceI
MKINGCLEWMFFVTLLIVVNAANSATTTTTGVPQAAQSPDSSKHYTVSGGSLDFWALVQPSSLKVHGTTSDMTGSMNQNKNVLSGFLEVPLKNFETGMAVRNSHLKEKVFETDKYDKAKLSITELKIPDGKTGEIKDLPFTGTLSLHGVDKPITGTVILTVGDKTISFEATTEIQYSDFNIPVQKFTMMTVQQPVKIVAKGDAKL